ncbi:MAG TPA: dihydrofolate reductase family protein [Solirubrobacterales bacterium]|nr:dihydrofolate reductase family protein [Solirubrobacterales bacterium]
MARLIYAAIASLDGYVADERGEFGWSAPDAEVHRFVNEREREVGTHLYGRRMYEVMRVWEDDEILAAEDPSDAAILRQYADIWRAADKIVYSRSLDRAATARTELRRSFDPEEVRRMKQAGDRDLSVGGAELAARAIEAGLVDEIQLFLTPIAIGAGKPALPLTRKLPLRLIDHRRFGSGAVYLRYET